MNRAALRARLEQLTEHHGWAYEPKTREAHGLHRGVGVSVIEEDGQLHFLFFATGANVGDEILAGFAGFQHFAATGLPLSWLSGRTSDDHSCVLCLDGAHLEAVGEERFLAIPDMVAQDFHDHGAAPQPVCQHCGQQPATEVKKVNFALVCLCPACASVSLTVTTVQEKPAAAP